MSWVGAAAQIGLPIVAGLFGHKKPKVPKELRRIYKFQMELADQQRRFAQSTPLSTPEEQAYLGQARGQLGEQLSNQRDQYNSLYNPLTMSGNAASGLLGQQNQQIGAQQNLQAEALMNAYQQRRQALSQASGMAANAAGAVNYQQQPQTDLAGTFGGLAHAIAMQRGMQQPDQGGFGAPGPVGDQSGWMQTHGFATTPGMANTQGMGGAQPFNPVAQTQGANLGGFTQSGGVFGEPGQTGWQPQANVQSGAMGTPMAWNFGQKRQFNG